MTTKFFCILLGCVTLASCQKTADPFIPVGSGISGSQAIVTFQCGMIKTMYLQGADGGDLAFQPVRMSLLGPLLGYELQADQDTEGFSLYLPAPMPADPLGNGWPHASVRVWGPSGFDAQLDVTLYLAVRKDTLRLADVSGFMNGGADQRKAYILTLQNIPFK